MKPVIYQMLPRYWGDYNGSNVCGASLEENGCGHFRDIDDLSLDYFHALGCTHIWYTGIIRHATSCDTHGCVPSHPQFIKGKAGSPYAITDYFDVNPYLAENPDKRMDEFTELVQRTHNHNLKVLIDFVPNHVSRDNVNFGNDDDKSIHWKAENDFFYYPGEHLAMPVEFKADAHFKEAYDEYPARATGNNCFSPYLSVNDWYETVKLNYCDFHTATWDKMLDILLHWASKGVDGFRCDMVELVPPEFFQWVIAEVKKSYPDVIFIAEVYKKEQYNYYLREIGFDYLYDKSGLYDALYDIVNANVNAPDNLVDLWQSTKRITANWQYLGDLQPQMLNFVENHDEVRIASEEYAGHPDKSLAAVALSALLNNAPWMLYYGQEVGEKGEYQEGFSGHDGRSSIFDWWKIESISRLYRFIHTGKGLEKNEIQLLEKYRTILGYARSNAFSEGMMYDLCYCNVYSEGFDVDRHFAFLRYNESECYLVACNFSNKETHMKLDVPVFDSGKVEATVPPYDFTVILLTHNS